MVLLSSTPSWESIGAVIGIVIVYYMYTSKQKQKRIAEEEESEAKKQAQKRKDEVENSVRIKVKLEKLDVLTKQVEEVETLKVEDVSELKGFIIANEVAIIEKGGDDKLFEFMKLDTFLNDYRSKIIADIEDITKGYSKGQIERAIKEYEGQDALTKTIDHFNDLSRTASGQAERSVDAKVDLLFKIGHKLKPTIETEIATLSFYKSLSIAMLLFYLDNKKIRFFEIYEAFEKLGVFDSSWQKNVASKLDSIDKRLETLNDQMTALNDKFSRIADSSEALVQEIKSGFADIAQRINVNNVLLGINAYQTYRINKNMQRQLGN